MAVPLIVIGTPGATDAPCAGEVMLDDGATWSVDAEAGTSPACSVTGCTPMSANRFTVAWRMRESTGVPLRS